MLFNKATNLEIQKQLLQSDCFWKPGYRDRTWFFLLWIFEQTTKNWSGQPDYLKSFHFIGN